MKNFLKHLFVPHEGNDHTPHILREFSVLIILFVILFTFANRLFLSDLLSSNKNLAAIYSAVLIDLTNKDRGENALNVLHTNPLLTLAAENKAKDMAARGYFAHNTPEGLTPWYWIEGAGYKFVYAGENLAIDFTDSDQVETAWMNSPGHRANILNGHFTDVGIATAEGMYQGRSAIFVVQEFGSPQQSVPVSVPSLPKGSVIPLSKTPQKSPIVVPDISTSTKQENLVVVSEDANFAEVKNASVKGESISVPDISQTAWYEKMIASPSRTLQIVYCFIAALLFIALLLFLLIEWENKKFKNFFYGLLLLAIMCGALYLNQSIFAGSAVI